MRSKIFSTATYVMVPRAGHILIESFLNFPILKNTSTIISYYVQIQHYIACHLHNNMSMNFWTEPTYLKYNNCLCLFIYLRKIDIDNLKRHLFLKTCLSFFISIQIPEKQLLIFLKGLDTFAVVTTLSKYFATV